MCRLALNLRSSWRRSGDGAPAVHHCQSQYFRNTGLPVLISSSFSTSAAYWLPSEDQMQSVFKSQATNQHSSFLFRFKRSFVSCSCLLSCVFSQECERDV